MPVAPRFQTAPIKTTPLSIALRVDALVRCDCGCTHFRVGAAYVEETGNNFLRLLECVECGHQMPTVHRADDSLEPSLSMGQLSSKADQS